MTSKALPHRVSQYEAGCVVPSKNSAASLYARCAKCLFRKKFTKSLDCSSCPSNSLRQSFTSKLTRCAKHQVGTKRLLHSFRAFWQLLAPSVTTPVGYQAKRGRRGPEGTYRKHGHPSLQFPKQCHRCALPRSWRFDCPVRFPSCRGKPAYTEDGPPMRSLEAGVNHSRSRNRWTHVMMPSRRSVHLCAALHPSR